MTDIELRLLISGNEVRLRTYSEAADRETQGEIRLDSLARKQIAVYERQLSLGTLTDRDELEVLGEQLYRILFNGPIAVEFERITSQSEEIDGRVHLVLEFDEPASELSRLPWEYLYRPSSGHDRSTFFIFRRDIALARRLAGAEPFRYQPAEPPLRVLVMAVNPPESTDVIDHRIASMQELQVNQALALRSFVQADFSASFIDEIRRWSPHVVHYIGGATAEGKLAFSDPDKSLQWVNINNLVDRLELADVRVIILELIEADQYEAASQGAPSSNDFRQIPVRLARALPATVVANQFPMASDARGAFFASFYDAAAQGIPVIDAVQRGRLALRNMFDGSFAAAFGTPVVYLQGVSDAALVRSRAPELVTADAAPPITLQSSRPDSQAQAPGAQVPRVAVADEAQVQAPSAPEPQMAVTDETAGIVADRLPAGGDAIVGREAELKRLLSILRRAGTRRRSRPPVVVVTGGSGVGKTFLAVHGARRLRERFPHGTLFVALGGPTRPGTLVALREALEDLEPEPRDETELPGSTEPLEALATRYRRAFSDRQILVLVDDALEASDVEPFIPPNPSSALVVTSTSQLSLPNAQILDLSPLKCQMLNGHGFEIKGISGEMMRLFSSRRESITADLRARAARFEQRYGRALSQRELARLAQASNFATRAAKTQTLDVEQMHAGWAETLTWTLGVSLASVAPSVWHDGGGQAGARPRALGDPGPVPGQVEVSRAAQKAVALAQQDKSAWTRADLIKYLGRVLPRSGMDPAAAAALLEEVADRALASEFEQVACLQAPEPVEVPASLLRADGRSVYQRHGGVRFATHTQLTMEQRVVALARASGAPRMDRADAARALGADLAKLEAALADRAQNMQGTRMRTGLRADQAAAALPVLTDRRRVSVINAPAGSGKTWVLTAAGQAWAAAGLGRVIGITPSQSARNTLAAGVPESYNTAQFPGHLPGQRGARGPIQLRPGDLVLMDEASMVSNPDLADVISQAADSGAKVILAGDTQQLQAVENGGGLSLLAGALGFGLAVITGTEDRQHAYVALSRGTDTAREAFGPLYLDVLGRFDALFGRPMPYIAAWHQAPVRDEAARSQFAAHLQVLSVRRAVGKLKYLAETESGMGVWINDIVPEEAAQRLGEAL